MIKNSKLIEMCYLQQARFSSVKLLQSDIKENREGIVRFEKISGAVMEDRCFGVHLHRKCRGNSRKFPGGVLGSIFAGYVPLASQNPYPIIVYSLANY